MALYGSFANSTTASPTVMGFSFFNRESIVDKTMLSFSMWKTTIKLGIYPLIESENDEVRYDRKGGTVIYLTPMKAWEFAQLLKMYRKDPKSAHRKGLPAGQSLITIEDPSDPKGFNKPGAGPCIVIRKINPDSGNMEASYAYETRKDNGTIVDAYDEKTGKFEQTIEFPFIELDMIIMQLETYTKAMTNAQAFATADALATPLDKIATKLGVDLNAGFNGAGSYKNNSYFTPNKASQVNYPENGLNNIINDNDIPF